MSSRTAYTVKPKKGVRQFSLPTNKVQEKERLRRLDIGVCRVPKSAEFPNPDARAGPPIVTSISVRRGGGRGWTLHRLLHCGRLPARLLGFALLPCSPWWLRRVPSAVDERYLPRRDNSCSTSPTSRSTTTSQLLAILSFPRSVSPLPTLKDSSGNTHTSVNC